LAAFRASRKATQRAGVPSNAPPTKMLRTGKKKRPDLTEADVEAVNKIMRTEI
jgi:hypothetical protein